MISTWSAGRCQAAALRDEESPGGLGQRAHLPNGTRTGSPLSELEHEPPVAMALQAAGAAPACQSADGFSNTRERGHEHSHVDSEAALAIGG